MLYSFFMAKKGCWRLPVAAEHTSESPRNTAEFGIHLMPSKCRASVGTNTDAFYLQNIYVGESVILVCWSKISPNWNLLSLWHHQWRLQSSAEHTHQRCRVTWHQQSRAQLKRRRSKACNSGRGRSRTRVCSVMKQGQDGEQWGGTKKYSIDSNTNTNVGSVQTLLCFKWLFFQKKCYLSFY